MTMKLQKTPEQLALEEVIKTQTEVIDGYYKTLLKIIKENQKLRDGLEKIKWHRGEESRVTAGGTIGGRYTEAALIAREALKEAEE